MPAILVTCIPVLTSYDTRTALRSSSLRAEHDAPLLPISASMHAGTFSDAQRTARRMGASARVTCCAGGARPRVNTRTGVGRTVSTSLSLLD